MQDAENKLHRISTIWHRSNVRITSDATWRRLSRTNNACASVKMSAVCAEVNKMAFQKLKKFKKEPKYPHNRSEGMTHRTNGGTRFQVEKKK